MKDIEILKIIADPRFKYNNIDLYSSIRKSNPLYRSLVGLDAYDRFKGMQDTNASTETVYPVTNNNSMNKKLEAAKKWLKDRK